MFLYDPISGILREETEECRIETLKRKGSVQIPDPEVPGSTWNGGEWEPPPPAEPIPQWVQFGVALGGTPELNQWYHALFTPQTSILHGMITVGLGQAAQGDPKTFLAAWRQATAAGLVPPELAVGVVEMAVIYDLPDDFVAALTAPTPN